MPEVNGHQVTAGIRELEKVLRTHVRIIGMTARAMECAREKCLAAGMDGYVSKPTRAAELYVAVEQVDLQGEVSDRGCNTSFFKLDIVRTAGCHAS